MMLRTRSVGLSCVHHFGVVGAVGPSSSIAVDGCGESLRDGRGRELVVILVVLFSNRSNGGKVAAAVVATNS